VTALAAAGRVAPAAAVLGRMSPPPDERLFAVVADAAVRCGGGGGGGSDADGGDAYATALAIVRSADGRGMPVVLQRAGRTRSPTQALTGVEVFAAGRAACLRETYVCVKGVVLAQ